MGKYQRQEVYDATLRYFNGDAFATEVWIDKYALKDRDGNYFELTPDDTWDRMATAFHGAETNYKNPITKERIREIFCTTEEDGSHKIRVIPGGSVLAGLGDDSYIGSLSNCLVIGQPEDSYHGIMSSREERVQLMKRRCGVGVDISTLRPEGTSVNNPAKRSTGPVSFMDVDSELTKEVAQEGRRGALMITISCKHPDVLKFINKKQDLTKVTGANISVQLTNEFMDSVKKNEKFVLRWPCDDKFSDSVAEKIKELKKLFEENKKYSYEEVFDIFEEDGMLMPNPNGERRVFMVIDAKDYWKTLVHCAWNTGEPGIMFFDQHRNYSPDGQYEKYKGVTTNPCGEIFMPRHDSCRLISVNLSSFVKKPFTEEAEFDFEDFGECVKDAIRLSDDLVDLECGYVDRIIASSDCETERRMWEDIQDIGRKGRRCGLGITALGDMIAMMNMKFDSDDALKFVKDVMEAKIKNEVEEEIILGKERGTFFGYDHVFEDSHFNARLKNIVGEKLFREYLECGRRNVSWSTVAPTGSLSILTQTTSGIEPIFSPYYVRRKRCLEGEEADFVDKNGQKFTEHMIVHPQMKKWFSVHGECVCDACSLEYKKDITQYKENELSKIFQYSPWYGSTANEINWVKRVEMQGVVGRCTTHSISSTINLPNNVTEEEVGTIYMSAYDNGLKGITVYRDGCRDGVLVKKEDCGCENTAKTLKHDAPKRPKSLPCDIKRFRNNKEKWVACVGLYNGQPYEIFTGLLDRLEIDDDVEEGIIVKEKDTKKVYDDFSGEEKEVKCSRYDLKYVTKDGEEKVVRGINCVFNNTFYGYGRMISAVLRHGMPLEYVVSMIKNISFDEETINSWKNGVIRAFKGYIADGEVSGEVCPTCGSKIIRENGCKRCSNCTWSACS